MTIDIKKNISPRTSRKIREKYHTSKHDGRIAFLFQAPVEQLTAKEW